jgi:hypothetical protein
MYVKEICECGMEGTIMRKIKCEKEKGVERFECAKGVGEVV